jgi:hypothetical protein
MLKEHACSNKDIGLFGSQLRNEPPRIGSVERLINLVRADMTHVRKTIIERLECVCPTMYQ